MNFFKIIISISTLLIISFSAFAQSFFIESHTPAIIHTLTVQNVSDDTINDGEIDVVMGNWNSRKGECKLTGQPITWYRTGIHGHSSLIYDLKNNLPMDRDAFYTCGSLVIQFPGKAREYDDFQIFNDGTKYTTSSPSHKASIVRYSIYN